MIQDIAPKIFHNEYQPVNAKAGDTVFVFREKQVLVCREEDGGAVFPTAEAFPEDLQYLFRIDERPYFLYLPENGDAFSSAGPAPGCRFVPLMEVRQDADLSDMFACMTAYHLFTWYDRNRLCGRCGRLLQHSGTERMLRCPDCGNMVFPVIAPAVIVGVTDGDRLLMTKYAGRAYKGWALIAGFCEIGETVEDTVRREVLEEAGIHVKNIRYVASQPWGSDSNLLIGMFCEAEGTTEIHMDREELSRAVWVDRREVPEMRDNHSLTGYMIELFRTGREHEKNHHR